MEWRNWVKTRKQRKRSERRKERKLGTDFQLPDVFCFTDFLSGFLFRVRVRVRTSVGD